MNAPLSAPLNRRSFFKLSALTGGGLVLAYCLKSGRIAKAAADTMEGSFSPSAFLRIAPDGTVTIVSARPEIGQGIKTSLPMVIAEELGVNWNQVKVVSAPLNAAFGQQTAGGSMSTPNSYLAMRKIGATARLMLVRAAAKTWGVPESECIAENGHIRHRDSGRTLNYGELAATAATLPVPEEAAVPLKDPKDFSLLGSRIGGVDNPKIVTGQPLFGLDQKVPGMKYAVYQKCPVFSGQPLSANLDHIKALPGVHSAFIISQKTPGLNGLLPGVAIVADSTWAAIKARRELEVKWNEGPHATDSWASFTAQAKALGPKPGAERLRSDGNVVSAFAAATKTVESTYSYPWVAHATLEPQNCTADVKGDRAELWIPTQNPEGARQLVAQVLGIPADNIAVTTTRSGGAFGRRGDNDYAAEAAVISRQAGVPIHLVWTREDDMQHDHYRPGGFHFLRGAVDAQGKLSAWRHHAVEFNAAMTGDDFPGRFVAHCLLESTQLSHAIPIGAWRAPRDNTFAWAVASFLDELAQAAGRDPIEFNLELLSARHLAPPSPAGSHNPPYNPDRMRGVIQLAAEKSNWTQPLPRGRGRGLGYYYSHRGYVAEVAEVTVSKAGKLTVDRVVAAVDVGAQIINLSGAEAQVQGALIDGLSAAWRQELDVDRGRMVQSNFHEYAMLRLPEAPRQIDIHFRKTDFPVTGLGEPGLPPIAPAVCNAVFAATGKRIRELPFSRTDLSWS